MIGRYKANLTHFYATIFGSSVFLPFLGPCCSPKVFYSYLCNGANSSYKQLLYACVFLPGTMLGMGAEGLEQV